MPQTHFSEDPPQVINQRDLQLANEKLKQSESADGIANNGAGSGTAGSGDDASSPIDPNGNGAGLEKLGTYDKYEITEDDCYDELGYTFPSFKKVVHSHRHLLGPSVYELQHVSCTPMPSQEFQRNSV